MTVWGSGGKAPCSIAPLQKDHINAPSALTCGRDHCVGGLVGLIAGRDLGPSGNKTPIIWPISIKFHPEIIFMYVRVCVRINNELPISSFLPKSVSQKKMARTKKYSSILQFQG